MSTPTPGRSAGIAEYLKRAFLYRWNVLLFGSGVVASVLSPWPDAVLALVAAGELVYLTQLISSNRFRDAIDAQVYQEGKQTAAVSGQRSIQELVIGLSAESKRRFEALRARCLEMRGIAMGVRGRTGGQPGEDISTPALDRLLWVFLRLLVSQEALAQFLLRTDIKDITTRLEEGRAKLAAQKDPDDRLARSLSDAVSAHEMRLANYEKAQRNAEFVRIELDRIEAKIQALTEAAVNRQDPDFLSGQIDSVTESMQTTEKTISELQQLTGLMDQMEEPPAILEADLGRVVQR
jgi:chemotaxis protein histidine kinase CheA